ncbi:head completion/stabilization protein [Pseudomonas sp. NyZ704]|nr:head completion/stabilization protein [Pseudomonas sp. NyZ704]
MSGFVGQAPTEPFMLSNDGFFPEIDATALRAGVRLSGDVSDIRLEASIISAMINTNRELEARKVIWKASGHNTLEAVNPMTIGGKNVLEVIYTRAVQALVAAEHAERYRGYDATASGAREDAEQMPTADDYRRDHRHAVRDLLGKGHATIELL